MRIDDFISQLISPVPAAPPRRQGGVAGVENGGLGAGSGRRPGIGSPRARATPSDADGAFPTLGARKARQADRADLSSLRASRAGASAGGLPEVGERPEPTGQATGADGASIVESFVRKRAVLAYRFPQQTPNGPQIDFTLEVEVAYRVIDIIPGGLVDEEG